MAGFVGQTSCVALINNHVDRSELKRYTQPQSEHQTTRLDPEAEQPLYEFMMQINLHPVHLVLCVGRSPALLRHLRPAAAVLDHLSRAETKRSSNVNEMDNRQGRSAVESLQSEWEHLLTPAVVWLPCERSLLPHFVYLETIFVTC
ncbi:hypothetical protein FHG87_023807 [Trinorchestia longiramus]|nr:hypothetical protein FHG87_023807 [Trinorchestia longiramus]